MAKTQTYSEELLVLAVEKYAAAHRGKIQMTKLAEWARTNVPGLEDVKDINFKRRTTVKNPKTGKSESIKRQCTIRIEEINEARIPTAKKNINTLLHSANIDEFINLPIYEQRESIIEARRFMENLRHENSKLRAEILRNRMNEEENSKISSEISTSIKKLQKAQEKLKFMVNQLVKYSNLIEAQEALVSVGVFTTGFDIKKFEASLSDDIDHLIDAYKSIKPFDFGQSADSEQNQDKNNVAETEQEENTDTDICGKMISMLNFNKNEENNND